MWPFGKKVACFHCDKKVKESATKLRRGFRFCSQACVDAFLAANAFPAPAGGDAEHRRELGNLMISALGELARAGASVGNARQVGFEIKTASGLVFSLNAANPMGGAINTALEQHQAEERTDAIHRFNGFASQSLPYLQALGLKDAFELFDTLDVDRLLAGNAALGDLHARVLTVVEQL